jgi:deferrochelatase/peroxidase EfeB
MAHPPGPGTTYPETTAPATKTAQGARPPAQPPQAGPGAPPPPGARLQRDLFVKGRGLGGSSDLTLLANVKPGLIESLESITYKTRIKRVLDLLHAARMDSHEYHAAQLLSDSVERVGAIQSVRVAVFEPEDEVLLSVTFDGPWEAYIRVLWDKVRFLLDLIFCSTEGYPARADCDFDEWLAWARSVQRETGFFYGPPAFTARDVLYARRLERTRMRGLRWSDDGKDLPPEVTELRTVLPTAEQAVEKLVQGNSSDDPGDVTPEVLRNRMLYERFRTGLQALAGLYKLTDLFPPVSADGPVLHRAATSLLREFVMLRDSQQVHGSFAEAHDEKANGRFRRELEWLFPDMRKGGTAVPPWRRATPPWTPSPDDSALLHEVQAGILFPYDGVTHGIVMLVALDSAAGAQSLLDEALRQVTLHRPAEGTTRFCNIAFTAAGLRACGLSEADMRAFPEEFLQGMAARAGLLGDVRHNHPRRWRLPLALDANGKQGTTPVELSGVHAVVQLRCADDRSRTGNIFDAMHPLHADFQHWRAKVPGARVLAVQPMKRLFNAGGDVIEPFGFSDGESEPRYEGVPARQRIRVGEVVLGHNNAADVQPPTDPQVLAGWTQRMKWLKNGSFLVVRKYRQFPERLAARVQAATDQLARFKGPPRSQVVEDVYAKLVGRDRNGEPLAQLNSDKDKKNDFSFDRDPNGKLCPLHAHIRLANPRAPVGAMARPPRLMRRSMSWGDPKVVGEGSSGKQESECGLVFMAYNASITEQFEVIQRWLTGGNSTGSSSGPSCPIVGVPENGVERHFGFERDGELARVQLEGSTPMFEEPDVVTQLEWGLYLFAPSKSVLGQLREAAEHADAAKPHAPSVSWDLEAGRRQLANLPTKAHAHRDWAIEQWKAALEDADAVDRQQSAALWAAIREDHGGVYDSPYGVIVADRGKVMQVLRDDAKYSISGQAGRMHVASLWPIYLGMDSGPQYTLESKVVNDALMALSADDAFAIAREATLKKLGQIRQQAIDGAKKGLATRYQVSFDAREIVDEVLATLCDEWFFDGKPCEHFIRGGADWKWQPGDPGIYPGHFIALSRYMFQPWPKTFVEQRAAEYGSALLGSMKAFVSDKRARKIAAPAGSPPAMSKITEAVFNSPAGSTAPDYAALTLAGIIMGFAPPITGALLNLLREWSRDGRFWELRAQDHDASSFQGVMAWLLPAMRQANQMRPMPQVIWRVAKTNHRIGHVDVKKDDIIVLGLVSGTQQSLEDGQPDEMLMFGGNRKAANPPTHACPGREAGMGAMAGALAAMLSFGKGEKDRMQPGLGALTFDLVGDSGYAPATRKETQVDKLLKLKADAEAFVKKTWTNSKWTSSAVLHKVFPTPPATRPLATRGAKGVIFAWGDSWLDYKVPFVHDFDLRNALAARGFIVNDGGGDRDDYCNWSLWGYLGQMAESVIRGDSPFLNYLSENMHRPDVRAILLSGGGNDSVKETLDTLLYPKDARPPNGAIVREGTNADGDKETLEVHLDKLRGNYERIVKAIREVYTDPAEMPPILVHGYDHPHVFVKGYVGGFGNEYQSPWMQDPFIRMGYTLPGDDSQVDRTLADQGMKIVIDRLNGMLKEFADGTAGVHYVDLRGTVPAQWDDNTRPGWFDNIHPNTAAFKLIAEKIDKEIAAIHQPQKSLLQSARSLFSTRG